MEDLLEDQEPVMKGPPFNPVIDLSSMSHDDDFINHARLVITTGNPQGHPPGMSSPTMQSLIDGLEVTRESYASIANPMRNQSTPSESSYNGSILSEDRESLKTEKHPIVFSPKAKAKTVKKTTKAIKVQLSSLEIKPVNKTRGNQHAIATLQEKSNAPRPQKARQVKVTERFGDYTSGTKQIASSAVGLRSSENTSVPSSSQPTMTISLDRQIDEDSSDGVASVIVLSPDNNKGDEEENEFPLITKVIRIQTGRHKEVASLNQHSYATLQQRSAEETDISDSSSDDDAGNGTFGTTSSSGSSTPAHLVFTPEEARYLRKGYDGQSIYDLVNPVDDMPGRRVYCAASASHQFTH